MEILWASKMGHPCTGGVCSDVICFVYSASKSTLLSCSAAPHQYLYLYICICELAQLLFCLQCNKVNSSVQLFSFPPAGTSAAKSSRRNATKKYRRGGATYPLNYQKQKTNKHRIICLNFPCPWFHFDSSCERFPAIQSCRVFTWSFAESRLDFADQYYWYHFHKKRTRVTRSYLVENDDCVENCLGLVQAPKAGGYTSWKNADCCC